MTMHWAGFGLESLEEKLGERKRKEGGEEKQERGRVVSFLFGCPLLLTR